MSRVFLSITISSTVSTVRSADDYAVYKGFGLKFLIQLVAQHCQSS